MKNFFSLKIFFSFLLFCRTEAILAKLSCDISAPNAILINADNGNVLFEKKAHERCYPASTTKVATVLYALYKQEGQIQGRVLASHDTVGIVSAQTRRYSGKHPSYRLEFGGTHAGIKVGEDIDVQDLIHAVMIASANDASNILAEWACGSVGQFMKELNLFLSQIGCSNTTFTNPHGLPDDEHMTTAADLAKMAYYATKYPFFCSVVNKTKYEYPATNKQPAFWMTQSNELLRPGKYYYPYATGIKTGYTQKAGHNLIASASKGDRNLIAVICGCDERSKRYRSAVDLFELAFNEVKQVRVLLSKESDLFHNEIEGAKNTLLAAMESDLTISFYPSEEPILLPKIEWMSLQLPILPGQKVGQVYAVDGKGRKWEGRSLIATKQVDPTWGYMAHQYLDNMKGWIKGHKVYIGYGVGICLVCTAFKLLKRKRLKRRRDRIL